MRRPVLTGSIGAFPRNTFLTGTGEICRPLARWIAAGSTLRLTT
jgi:hypothetical protein